MTPARKERALELLAVFAVAAAVMAFYEFQHRYLLEVDGFYHIKVAWLMARHGFFHGFPWAATSLWADTYSDTCLLFHVYLMPFTLLPNLAFAAKLATVLLAASVFMSFHWILLLHGVRRPRLWTLLLLVASPYFIWRMDVPRPQTLSVLLFLWSIHFLLARRRGPFLALCFLYPFAYAAAFLPVLLAAARSLHLWVWRDERDWKTPALAAGACALGLVLNPYFPNDLYILYVQDFYVLAMRLFPHAKLDLGQELSAMSTLNLMVSHVPVLGAWLFVSQLGGVLGRRAGERAQVAGAFALMSVGMMAVSQRFVEYAVPAAVLYVALRGDELLAAPEVEAWLAASGRRRLAAAGLAAFFLVGGAANGWAAWRQFWTAHDSPLQGAAAWLKAHAAPGQQVFTCHWADGPQLMFFDDAQRYMVMMDPSFMYDWNATMWKTWVDAAKGRLGEATYPVLHDAFRARYGVCGPGYLDLYHVVKDDPRMRVVYQDKWSFVFDLDPAPRTVSVPSHVARERKPAHG